MPSLIFNDSILPISFVNASILAFSPLSVSIVTVGSEAYPVPLLNKNILFLVFQKGNQHLI